ncbi:tail fiber domain-containing protein, partial [Bacillus cereus group sp. BfR-BA-01355]
GDSNNPTVPAVFGEHTASEGVGVLGRSQSGYGVLGESTVSDGVRATSQAGAGVSAYSENLFGVWGLSNKHIGIFALTRAETRPALMAYSDTTGGDIIIGTSRNAGEVFRVLNNGDVNVRGVNLTSDKNSKENFSSVDTLEILDKLASIPIQSWNYKDDTSNERHIGPTAQDFHAVFELNEDDNKHISTVDLQGVALAAIQGLNEKLQTENDELYKKLANLEERLSVLESKS